MREQLELFCVTQEEVDHIRETDGKLYNNKRGKLLQDRWAFVANTANRYYRFLVPYMVSIQREKFRSKHFMNECKDSEDKNRNKLVELKASHGGRGSAEQSRERSIHST